MRRKPITQQEMEAAYRLCLERELDRERKATLTKQGAFEASFIHIDFGEEENRERESSKSWLSDHGRGAREIYRALDPRPPKPTRRQLLNRAQMRVKRRLPDCLMTFWLVIKNRNNWKESVWEIMQRSTSKKHANGRLQNASIVHNSKKS